MTRRAVMWLALAVAACTPVSAERAAAPAARQEARPGYHDKIEAAEKSVADGDLDRAERLFGEARSLDPKRIEARYGLAFVMSRRCSLHKRQCRECLDAFDVIVDEEPYRHSYYNRAHCAFELGRHDAALADLDRAVELSPSDLDYRMTRALMRLHVGRTDEACEDLRTAETLGGDVRMVLRARCGEKR